MGININAFTPMSYEKVLEQNLFKDCPLSELQLLWNELRSFYNCGFIPNDCALASYRDKYNNTNKIGLGIIRLDKDLLTAIACKTIEEGCITYDS